MKFSFAYVKQHPYMFGAIALIFGLGLWLVLNKGSGAASSGGVVAVNSKSDNQAALEAQVAIAGMQLQAQQYGAQTQVAALAQQGANEFAVATLQSQVALAGLASQERTDEKTLSASTSALQLQLDNALQITNSNNQFMVDYARTAADSAVEQLRINAALQTELSEQQLDAYKTSSILSIIPSLKKKDRDESLQIIGTGILTGTTPQFFNARGPAIILPSLPAPAPAANQAGNA